MNRFVAAVSGPHRKAFLAECETVELEAAQQLAERHGRFRHVYFPTTACISQRVLSDAGEPGLEVSLAGAEGMVGATLLLGVDFAPLCAVVQQAGLALRMEGPRFAAQVAQHPRLARLVKFYLYVQTVQLAQGTVCNRFHSLEQRLARRLLMAHDRAQGQHFNLTHESLAAVLGVRRVGITQAATALQDERVIRYQRGRVSVLDRARLEAAACDCYAADNSIYTQLMS
jgi:CRP-like cAMP-binding protein